MSGCEARRNALAVANFDSRVLAFERFWIYHTGAAYITPSYINHLRVSGIFYRVYWLIFVRHLSPSRSTPGLKPQPQTDPAAVVIPGPIESRHASQLDILRAWDKCAAGICRRYDACGIRLGGRSTTAQHIKFEHMPSSRVP